MTTLFELLGTGLVERDAEVARDEHRATCREDPRKVGLKNGLRQLTAEQLQRVLDYPYEMVLDTYNYLDGKFCPLSVALELDQQITEPTHEKVFDRLTELGYKVYNTRGIEGKFYTDDRKNDLLEATREVLEELRGVIREKEQAK
jgi:hypothetical protein